MPIGSIISGVANLHNALVNTGLGIANTAMQFGQNKQNQRNWEESFQYQKGLNNILMEREDNAVQRRAADLAAAGINPMIAGLGGGAQATAGTVLNPLAQTAPQIPIGTGTIDGNAIAGAIEEMEKRKSAEKIAEDTGNLKEKEIENNLRIAENEIRASNMREDKKNETLAEIAFYQTMMDYKTKLMLASNENEQKKLDRQLQEMIAYHDWTKSLIKTGIKPVDTAIEQAYNLVRSEEEERKLQGLGRGETLATEGIKFDKDEKGYYTTWTPEFGKNRKAIKAYVKEDREGRQYYERGVVKHYIWRKDRVNLEGISNK